MQDKAKQCNTTAQPSPLTTERRRPTKDASITFRAPSALGSALREIAQRADRSLGYVCVTALTAYVTASKEAGHAL